MRNLHGTKLLHTGLAPLLLLKQLALTSNVAPVALRRHVLTEWSNRRAGQDLPTDRGLDRYSEHLPGNHGRHPVYNPAPDLIGLLPMRDNAQSVYTLLIDQNIDLYEGSRPILNELIIHARVAPREAL